MHTLLRQRAQVNMYIIIVLCGKSQHHTKTVTRHIANIISPNRLNPIAENTLAVVKDRLHQDPISKKLINPIHSQVINNINIALQQISNHTVNRKLTSLRVNAI